VRTLDTLLARSAKSARVFALPGRWARLIDGCERFDLASTRDRERLRVRRKLQHRAGLSDAKPRQENDLSAWKFQRIVMFIRGVEIDLPEARDLLA
jgi:hypothetical protein